ncbi:hypothetical protein QTP88_020577 [Uroleucon formosanum]
MSNKKCIVFHCANRSNCNQAISSYAIPNEGERLIQWLNSCNRTDLLERENNNRSNNKNLRGCNCHFETNMFTQRKRLKPNAEPTLFGESAGMCCLNGTVRIPNIHEPPEPMKTLLESSTNISKHFLENINKYNNAFHMTPFGAAETIVENYMPTFKIKGQVYHLAGLLMPLPNTNHKYLQVYFMDDEEEQIDARMGVCSGLNKVIGIKVIVDFKLLKLRYTILYNKDQIYSIVNNGKINKANKLYNRIIHNYEIIMGPMTIITSIENTSDVVPTYVTLMTLDSIISLNNDAIVDTIGVIICIEDIVDIVKPTKTLKLRDVIIADNTEIEITLTLWNEEASVFSGKIEDVLSVEKGKLVIYKKGKKLSVTQSTVIQINPNWPEKQILKEWYKKEGQYQVDRMDFTQLSSIDNTTLNQSVDDKILSQIVEDEKSTKRRLNEIYTLQQQLQN